MWDVQKYTLFFHLKKEVSKITKFVYFISIKIKIEQ